MSASNTGLFLLLLVLFGSIFIIIGTGSDSWQTWDYPYPLSTTAKLGLWEMRIDENVYTVTPDCFYDNGLPAGNPPLDGCARCRDFNIVRAFTCMSMIFAVPGTLIFAVALFKDPTKRLFSALFLILCGLFGIVATSFFVDLDMVGAKGFSFNLFTAGWVMNFVGGILALKIHGLKHVYVPGAETIRD
jgi:hypothetical protein